MDARLELALIACVLSTGLFHAALSVTRPSREIQLFSFACFVLAFRMAAVAGHVPAFLDLSLAGIVRVDFLTLALLPALGTGLVARLFPSIVPGGVERGIYAVCGLAMAAALAIPALDLPRSNRAFLAICTTICALVVAAVAKAATRRGSGAWLLLAAFAIALGMVAYDGSLVPAANTGMAFAFAVVLGQRLNEALAESDRLAASLREANELLEQKVGQRTLELERVAMTDPLTGLWNRRSLLMLAEIERARTERTKEKLGVMMIDCDDFKIVNDLHGHEAGDQVLLGLAQRFQALVRPTDLLSRWGGEEFVMVFSTNTVAGAKSAADRMRHKVAGLPFDVASDVALSLTVSIGVAVLEDAFESFEDVLRRADRALYWAKAAGKNKVKVDEAAD